VDIYDRTWAWIQDGWSAPGAVEGAFFSHPGSGIIHQSDAVYSSFFLVYSNKVYKAHEGLDMFYERQGKDGEIRAAYEVASGRPVGLPGNESGIGSPLFAWAEHNIYHKTADKKRLKDILPILDKYNDWIDSNFRAANGLYRVPSGVTGMLNSPRPGVCYPMDFNTMMAVEALYMSAMADIQNDKDMSFKYKKLYFSLKTRINSLMWDGDDGFYYDLDKDEKRVKVKTLACYWSLLAEIVNDEKAERIIAKLSDPKFFGAPHPFPSLALCEPDFDENGQGYLGSVFPHLTFMVIKGLERYQKWELARECAIRHVYFMLDSMGGESSSSGTLWEAYLPTREGPATWQGREGFPKSQHIACAALSTISLTIENIVGLNISLPRKTVDWIIPSLEIMGIENLSLKKNLITILSNRSGRGWEIQMESEKLYYFTVNILGKKKKTLPIPSGKCSMLIDKL